MRAVALDAHTHLAADGRELDRVQQEVPDDLLQTARLAHDGADARLELRPHGDALGRRRGAHGVHGSLDDAAHVRRLGVEA